jgi:SAM-dependent methyltransferase
MFCEEQFNVVNAPLCLDYIEDWTTLFREFRRILQPGGTFVFSAGHPFFDAEYFDTKQYFSVERVSCMWTGFGKHILMPSYRRSLEEFMMPVINSGFQFEKIHEPLPTEEFQAADPKRYANLMHRPGFLCVRARKPA